MQQVGLGIVETTTTLKVSLNDCVCSYIYMKDMTGLLSSN